MKVTVFLSTGHIIKYTSNRSPKDSTMYNEHGWAYINSTVIIQLNEYVQQFPNFSFKKEHIVACVTSEVCDV